MLVFPEKQFWKSMILVKIWIFFIFDQNILNQFSIMKYIKSGQTEKSHRAKAHKEPETAKKIRKKSVDTKIFHEVTWGHNSPPRQGPKIWSSVQNPSLKYIRPSEEQTSKDSRVNLALTFRILYTSCIAQTEVGKHNYIMPTIIYHLMRYFL